MKLKNTLSRLIFCCLLACSGLNSGAHEIIFCGERIPVGDKFVSDKLMNIIKKQINYVNVLSLKERVNQYMSQVEYYLHETNIPQDFKYLAIVESGFKNATSSAGAAGFWQLMPETARELGLVVNGLVDDRNDFNKATYAACKVLANYYLYIRKQFGISSWVLTAAAYNNGIGNIQNAIKKQGTNYFQMQLNEETAAYVYKIIAVKELFEYPELYMHDFGYNIFTKKVKTESKDQQANNVSEKLQLGGMTVKIDESDGVHPVNLDNKLKTLKKADPSKIKFISAQVTGKYKNFKDGEIVSFILQEELQVFNRYSGKGTVIQGRGWIIDDRVQIDLGFDHTVILLDLKNEKGIALKKLKNKEKVLMKVSTLN
ncbi:MAG: lytic transglycosylase domain-containing protein [Chitinophagaceae bacterium]|nr:lytic transglycosylase domain-containing protein [Chitinophagaceae bacterium]